MRMLSDEVEFQGERVIVYAARPMDWPVREFAKVPIWFQGRKYFLRTKREGSKPPATIYELCPWPADLHEASVREIVYDEAYVRTRDEAATETSTNIVVHFILLPFYPFLGLFWSGFKQRVLSPIGFEERSITNASLVLTANLCIVQAIFTGWLLGGTFTYLLNRPLRALDWSILLLLMVDSVARGGQALQSDVERRWGFCEWLWPRRGT